MSIIQTFYIETKIVDNNDIFNLISYIIVLSRSNVYISPIHGRTYRSGNTGGGGIALSDGKKFLTVATSCGALLLCLYGLCKVRLG